MPKEVQKGKVVIVDSSRQIVAIFVTVGNVTKSAIKNGLSPEKRKEAKSKLDTVKVITSKLTSVYYLPGVSREFKAMGSPYGVFEALRESVGSVGWHISGVDTKFDVPQNVSTVEGSDSAQAYQDEVAGIVEDQYTADYWEWLEEQGTEKQ